MPFQFYTHAEYEFTYYLFVFFFCLLFTAVLSAHPEGFLGTLMMICFCIAMTIPESYERHSMVKSIATVRLDIHHVFTVCCAERHVHLNCIRTYRTYDNGFGMLLSFFLTYGE